LKNTSMKQLNVLYCREASFLTAQTNVQLNSLERHAIDLVPWSSYPYKPEVSFSITYNDDHIFLKYYVEEKAIRASADHINGKVWEDTCVEFFISFDDTGYYNLEFNCIGSALAGFGKNRYDRQLLPEEVISRISTQSIIRKTSNNLVHWELSLAIPLDVFVNHSLSTIKGRQCRANFYKCGDLLPEPHFLSWSPINSDEPNFHLPQFFGTLYFAYE
jgi:hypothetical protein